MAVQKVKVMVVGGSGNIGTLIIEHLLNYFQHFAVSATTRPDSKSTFAAGVNVVRTGYSLGELTAAFRGQDVVICTISTASLGDQMTIAQAAVAAKVKRFIPAEVGMDTSDDKVMKVAPCLFLKRDVISFLRKTEDTTTWTGHFTGLWIDFSLISPDWLWWSIKDKKMTIFDDGNVPFEATTVSQAAEAVVKSILPEHYDATRNQFVYVRSAVFTPNVLLDHLKKHIEGDWKVEHRNIQELAAEGQKIFHEEMDSGQAPGKRFLDAIILMVSAALMGNGGVNQFGDRTKPWMERLGMVEEDPGHIVKRTVEQWRAGALSNWSR